MSLSFNENDAPLSQIKNDGLSANECYSQTLVDDPFFALVNRDSYFRKNDRTSNSDFANPPSAQLINEKSPPFRKRDISYLDSHEFILENFNSSRRLAPNELDQIAEAITLDEHLAMLNEQMEEVAAAYVDCIGDDCATSTKLLPL